jgi:hypothetical protein
VLLNDQILLAITGTFGFATRIFMKMYVAFIHSLKIWKSLLCDRYSVMK